MNPFPWLASAALVLVLASAAPGLASSASAAVDIETRGQCAPLFDHRLRKLHAKQDLDLCALTRGKLTLVVNTASQCGFTPQFEGLEALHKKYRDQGLVVIGFPSDDFRQELKDEAGTAKVCYVNYGVTFPMLTTSAVRGGGANPVFQVLNREAGEPAWNFNKYLVAADGQVLKHFPSRQKPLGGELEAMIRNHLP